jgi:hypothetical protein
VSVTYASLREQRRQNEADAVNRLTTIALSMWSNQPPVPVAVAPVVVAALVAPGVPPWPWRIVTVPPQPETTTSSKQAAALSSGMNPGRRDEAVACVMRHHTSSAGRSRTAIGVTDEAEDERVEAGRE